jgi:hypothetical protein
MEYKEGEMKESIPHPSLRREGEMRDEGIKQMKDEGIP